ncbi:MAG: hypothetical protein WCL39_05045 [Armatimonadota bacterium]
MTTDVGMKLTLKGHSTLARRIITSIATSAMLYFFPSSSWVIRPTDAAIIQDASVVIAGDTSAPASSIILNPTNFISGGVSRISNGGFENTGDWTFLDSAGRFGGDAHSGTESLRIAGNGLGGSAFQQVTLTANSRPVLSFWYKGGGTTAGLSVRTSDISGLLLPFPALTLVSDWTKISLELSAFAGQNVSLVFQSDAADGSAPVILVDDVSVTEGATVYVPYPNTQVIHAYDAESALATPVYVIDDEPSREGVAFSLTGDGFHTVHYQIADAAGNTAPFRAFNIAVDNQGPTGVFSINGNASVTTSPSVILNTLLSDTTQVKDIRIKSDVGAFGLWQPYQPAIAFTFASTTPGTKSVCVQAQDVFGNSTTLCDSIEYKPTQTVDIPHAKLLAAGASVRLENKLVTAIFSTIPGFGSYYITEADSRSGILVVSTSGLPSTIGAKVTVEGITDATGAELKINAASTQQSPGSPSAINPRTARTATLGGAAFGEQLGVTNVPYGLNTVGLLLRVAGTVTARTSSSFYLDDGQGIEDGNGNRGVLVIVPAGVTPPQIGTSVTVVGISSIQNSNANRIRVLKVRTAADIR